MQTRVLLLTLLALGAAPPSAGRDDPTDALRIWTATFERGRRALDGEREAELRAILMELRTFSAAGLEQSQASLLSLFDLYGAGHAAARELERERALAGERVLALAESEAEPLIDKGLSKWVASEVLVRREGPSAERRAAAALVMRNRRTGEVRLALAVCARDPDALVREAAWEALIGWDFEAAHTLYLEALLAEDTSSSAALRAAAEAHFGQVSLPLGSRAEGPLLEIVRAGLESEDWRRASWATALSHALADRLAVPVLVAALERWMDRALSGAPVRRVQNEVVLALQDRSGRRIGPHPERWKTWWAAVEAGDVEPRRGEDDPPETRAGFFGLRPVTDRVTFVIDRSGSMNLPFTGNPLEGGVRSRYQEAAEQMQKFLEGLGERTRFNVVVFSDGADAWRANLAQASPASLKEATSWLLRRRPEGGTQLRHGVERAVRLRLDGSVDLEHLETDTIIVLCDGQTAEGLAWVRPLLRRINHEARLVIHCVQIGGEGDGTLELMAELTGGEFIQVQPEGDGG